MPQILDEDAMSPCMGEEQMSLNCRAMYSDRETMQDGIQGVFGVKKPAEECKHVIENYRNCKKFWTKYVRSNGVRFAPRFEDREQIIAYMKKTGVSPYEYVEPSENSGNVLVDVNIGRDMERIKKEEEFDRKLKQKLAEKFEKQTKS